MSHWRILRDKGKTYSLEQFWSAIADCLFELKEQVDKLRKDYGNHIEHYHTP